VITDGQLRLSPGARVTVRPAWPAGREPLRALHPPAGHDHAGHGRDPHLRIVGYTLLPVSDLPNVDYPTISVGASLPGAAPRPWPRAVATPLEKQFSTIAGVDAMTSSSALGSTSITLQFALDRDIDAAAQDVQAAIARTPALAAHRHHAALLPEGPTRPTSRSSSWC